MNSINTLEVYRNNEIVFSSTGKWLYPLFDLENFINDKNLAVNGLLIKDKIIGKASAMLIYRLGFNTVEATILSMPAKVFFEKKNVHYVYKKLVDVISCKTEILLHDVDDPEEAYRMLKERAGI